MVEFSNNIYEEAVNRSYKVQKMDHERYNVSKEDPLELEDNQEDFNRRQGIKAKTKHWFETAQVSRDRNQTYEDNKNRKLHKTKMRRIRK